MFGYRLLDSQQSTQSHWLKYLVRSLAWFKSIQCLHCNVTVDKIKVDWVYVVVDRALISAIQSFGMLSQIHQEVLVYACRSHNRIMFTKALLGLTSML